MQNERSNAKKHAPDPSIPKFARHAAQTFTPDTTCPCGTLTSECPAYRVGAGGGAMGILGGVGAGAGASCASLQLSSMKSSGRTWCAQRASSSSVAAVQVRWQSASDRPSVTGKKGKRWSYRFVRQRTSWWRIDGQWGKWRTPN